MGVDRGRTRVNSRTGIEGSSTRVRFEVRPASLAVTPSGRAQVTCQYTE
jgi:hypothetical protein